MDLKDVEISLGIQFPKLFHEVHNSGMTFFGEMMGDCQMIAFEDLRRAYDDLDISNKKILKAIKYYDKYDTFMDLD